MILPLIDPVRVIDAVRAAPVSESRADILLGHPESDGCDKTWVTPGGAFSPGREAGRVSFWVETADGLWSPEAAPAGAGGDSTRGIWGFSGDTDSPPLVESAWPAGEALSVRTRMGHLSGPGAEGVDFCALTLAASRLALGTLWIAVRPDPKSDTEKSAAEWDAHTNTLGLSWGPRLVLEQAPAHVEIVPAAAGPPLALLGFPFTLAPGETLRRTFRAVHGFAGSPFADQIPRGRPYETLSVDKGLAWSGADWQNSLPGRIFAPDPRLARRWNRTAYALLASCECGVPRGADGADPRVSEAALALRALDILGRFDLGRSGCEWLAPLTFSGPWGAEADAPGQGIWALAAHAEITDDYAWLEAQFPFLIRRVAWLEQMTGAEAPLWAVSAGTARANTPGVRVVCLASEGGLIQGRIGGEMPLFLVNAWAVAGFRRAADAADALGRTGLCAAWQSEADRLEDALTRLPLADAAQDLAAVPHPADILSRRREDLRAALGEALNTLPPASISIGAVHNAFRLGLDGPAWAALESRLDDEQGTEEQKSGEDAAAWILLLRDLFVRDDGDRPVLGPHLPDAWRVPGARFGVRSLPTRFGLISYEAVVGPDGAITLDYDGPDDYLVAWELTARLGRFREKT